MSRKWPPGVLGLVLYGLGLLVAAWLLPGVALKFSLAAIGVFALLGAGLVTLLWRLS